MDPKACIEEQVKIAAAIVDGKADEQDVDRLAELVLALDEWRRRGGFDPYGAAA